MTILCRAASCFHFASSSFTRVANAAGLIAVGKVPSGPSSTASSGDAAIALISRFSRSTTAAGVPAGAKTPIQMSIS